MLLMLTMALEGSGSVLARSQSPDGAKSQAGRCSLLYSFQCSPDGDEPESGLVRDASGNLYGTTLSGGQYSDGTVFKVTSSGTETVLHSFAGYPSDGSYPELGSLTLDAAGNLYGTTSGGGEFGEGAVFKVTATGTGTESILYSFCAQSGCTDGSTPFGGMARDNGGNLYGATDLGGTYDDGVVFKLTTGGIERVLHNFKSSPTDGAYPESNLIRDSSGNLYGTTYTGGASSAGTVFKVTAGGAESLLYSFKGSTGDGAQPQGGGLLLDTSDNLYGVTTGGGPEGIGVVFKLTSGDTESALLNFTRAGGEHPVDGLARAVGSLYGTTGGGGLGTSCGPYGCGVLFGLTMAGTEVVLHQFTLNSFSDGANPRGGVIVESGNLYGTLQQGGAYGCGAVFKYTT